jgi:hypothetical protein
MNYSTDDPQFQQSRRSSHAGVFTPATWGYKLFRPCRLYEETEHFLRTNPEAISVRNDGRKSTLIGLLGYA